MTRRWLNLATLVVLASAAAACDSPTGINKPVVVAPTAPAVQPRAAGIVLGRWAFVTGSGVEQSTVAVVDGGGYTIRFEGGSLTVPRGAVSAPTFFKVTLRTQPYIVASLSAATLSGQPVSSFPVPLTLTLSYGSMNLGADPSKLAIFWMQNGTLLEKQTSTVDPVAGTVSALVTHFSDYGPILIIDEPSELP